MPTAAKPWISRVLSVLAQLNFVYTRCNLAVPINGCPKLCELACIYCRIYNSKQESFAFIFWRLPGLWAGCSEREIRNIWAKLTCKIFEMRQSACVENIWVRKMVATFFPSLLYFEFRVLSCWFLFCTTSEIFRVMNIRTLKHWRYLQSALPWNHGTHF